MTSNLAHTPDKPMPTPLWEKKHSMLWYEIKDYVMILIGTLLYAGSVSIFMLPYGLTTGGVAGVSSIIYYATNIPVYISYGVINAIFLIIAVKILGWKFCLKTIAGVAFSTLWYSVWQFLLFDPSLPAIDGIGAGWPHVCGNQIFMACILGPLCCGIGLSICFENHGSTGGTDIIAAIINKYKDISLGGVILLCDILIISSCYFVFHDVERVIYGYVLMIVCAFTLDTCTRKVHQAVKFEIYSRNYSRVADAINEAGFGATIIHGTGWYTKSTRNVLVCVCSRRYQDIIMRIIKHVDEYAFFTVSKVDSVYGEGFGTMKTTVKGDKPVIVFATDDEEQLHDMRERVGERFDVRSLSDIGCIHEDELPQTHDTLQEQTEDKARYVQKFYGFDTIAMKKGAAQTAYSLIYKRSKYNFTDIEKLTTFLLQLT